MKKNMGLTDRVVRIVAAIILAALVVTGTIQGTLGIIVTIFSIVFLLTSLIGYCPLYSPLGLNSIGKKSNTKVN